MASDPSVPEPDTTDNDDLPLGDGVLNDGFDDVVLGDGYPNVVPPLASEREPAPAPTEGVTFDDELLEEPVEDPLGATSTNVTPPPVPEDAFADAGIEDVLLSSDASSDELLEEPTASAASAAEDYPDVAGEAFSVTKGTRIDREWVPAPAQDAPQLATPVWEPPATKHHTGTGSGDSKRKALLVAAALLIIAAAAALLFLGGDDTPNTDDERRNPSDQDGEQIPPARAGESFVPGVMANGVTVHEDGTLTWYDGSTVSRDGVIRTPDGAVLNPEGGTVLPDGTVETANGSRYEPPAPPEGWTPPAGSNDPGTNPGTDSGADPGTDPGTNPGADPGTDPGTNPGADPETDPGTDPGDGPGAGGPGSTNPTTTSPPTIPPRPGGPSAGDLTGPSVEGTGPNAGGNTGPSVGGSGPSAGDRTGPSTGDRTGPSVGDRTGPSIGDLTGPTVP